MKPLSKAYLDQIVVNINLILADRKTQVQQALHVIHSIYEIHKYNNSLSVNHLHQDLWRLLESKIVQLLLDKKEILATKTAQML